MKQKFLLVAIAILSLTVTTNAQIKQGEKMLGGNISFTNTRNKVGSSDPNSKATSFTISPQFGVGLGKNWVVGITAGYGYAKAETHDPTVQKAEVNTYSIGLFGRKFHPFTDQFGIYGQLTAEAGFGKTEVNTSNIKPKTRILSGYAQPGLYFIPGKKIILEATFGTLGYSSTRTDNGNNFSKTTENELNLSVTDGLSLGIKVII